MKGECNKCGYLSLKNKEKWGKVLCEFCAYFCPEEEEQALKYIDEKVDCRNIQTFRKQGFKNKLKQKRAMKEGAKSGRVMSRAPFGYKIVNRKLIPSEHAELVVEVYESFLSTNLSLNQLRRKYALSVNGLKKVLTNFTYVGKIKFDGQVHEGEHEAIISSTLFNHVQDKLKERGIKNHYAE